MTRWARLSPCPRCGRGSFAPNRVRQRGNFHSHEESGGIEVWVVLEGAVRFEIEDETVIATAGQAVVAWPHEKHRVSCAGDEPAVYYLTVTPHRSPTHTHYDAAGRQQPPTPGVIAPTWRGEPALGVK